MKSAVWLFFAGLVVTTVLASVSVWAAEDIIRDVFIGQPFPAITDWVFMARVWLPLLPIAWLPTAIRLSRSATIEMPSAFRFMGTCFLASLTIAGMSIFACLLPWMRIIPVLRE